MSATVLLIEDYSAHRAMLHATVGEMGYLALEAADGRTGLALAAEHQPAMIVLDLLLPDLDGLEVLRRLKAAPETAAIPVLIASSVDGPDRMVEALEAGAEDYVTKPYPVAVLQARMQAILRTGRLQRDLARQARQAELAARFGRTAASGDISSVANEICRAYAHESEAAAARLFVQRGEGFSGPWVVRGVEPVDHPLEALLQRPVLGRLLCGEVPWQRVNASDLGPLGRGLEGASLVAIPLRGAARTLGLLVLVATAQPLRDQAIRRAAELGPAAVLALSACLERTVREESDRRYHLLFEQSPDGLAVVDAATGTVREANQTLASWLAAVPMALSGRMLSDFFPAAQAAEIGELVRLAASGQRAEVESLPLADGGDLRLPVALELRRIRSAAGGDLVAILRDRRAEPAGESETRAAQNLKQLARTVRALNHEINNPLTCIIGLTQLLQLRLKEAPEHQSQLNRVLESAEQINQIGRQLRAAAISLAGDEPLEQIEDLLRDLSLPKGH